MNQLLKRYKNDFEKYYSPKSLKGVQNNNSNIK